MEIVLVDGFAATATSMLDDVAGYIGARLMLGTSWVFDL